jgi:glutathione synthase/RimK-type ligase-like ATP-grasp enzyme
MLDCYHRNGVPVPPTLFTNDPDRVRAFVAEHGTVVAKPVTMGAAPERLTGADLTDDRLERLAAAPVQFQRYVPGEDVRAYVLDGTVVGSFRYEYGEESFSFKRADPDAVAAEPVSLSERSREAIRTAGELAPAAFGVVDCRRPPDGSVVVLETNLPGRFAAADTAGVTDVAGALAAYLTGEEVEREAA